MQKRRKYNVRLIMHETENERTFRKKYAVASPLAISILFLINGTI